MRGNVIDDDGDHDARAADTGLAVADGRVNADVLAPVFHDAIVTRRSRRTKAFDAPRTGGHEVGQLQVAQALLPCLRR